jgi:hypothetical protein
MDDEVKNKIVHHLLLDNTVEFNQVLAYLPRAVADGLVRALDEAGEAYRYDADSRRAYYLRRKGSTLNMWSWDDVQSVAEYGELVSLIVRLDVPFDLEQANKVYQGATGRSASEPTSGPSAGAPPA